MYVLCILLLFVCVFIYLCMYVHVYMPFTLLQQQQPLHCGQPAAFVLCMWCMYVCVWQPSGGLTLCTALPTFLPFCVCDIILLLCQRCPSIMYTTLLLPLGRTLAVAVRCHVPATLCAVDLARESIWRVFSASATACAPDVLRGCRDPASLTYNPGSASPNICGS